MAQRDRSQGFGFVYVDISALLAQRDQIRKEYGQPIANDGAQAVNFPKTSGPKRVEPSPESAPTQAVRERQNAVVQIRENLDRLQSLHHKLHAMLAELNQISGRKKE